MKIRQKDIDIYARYRSGERISDRKIQTIAAVLPIILTVIAVSAVIISVKSRISDTENNIRSVNDRIYTLQQNGSQNGREISEAFEDIISAPRITSGLISEIEKSKNISVESFLYSSENCSLEISCHSDSAAGISEFISNLRESGLCSDIVYSGYQTDEKGFAFTAVCIIGQEDKSDE
ncbi:MAG TPA: hypothetical protein DIW26_08395 [Ruminococcus sp.]|mgnify:FL=1|nr:hypothetical protein [Ruminococcus sp.]